MTTRTEVIDQLVQVVPTLHAEGWLITPSNTQVGHSGTVTLMFWPAHGDLARVLVARLSELLPGVAIRVDLDAGARHVVSRR